MEVCARATQMKKPKHMFNLTRAMRVKQKIYIKDSTNMETKKEEVENKKMDKAAQKNGPTKEKKITLQKVRTSRQTSVSSMQSWLSLVGKQN